MINPDACGKSFMDNADNCDTVNTFTDKSLSMVYLSLSRVLFANEGIKP